MLSLPSYSPIKSHLEDGRFRESHGISGEVLQHQVRDLREHVRPPPSKSGWKERLAEFRTGKLSQTPSIYLLIVSYVFLFWWATWQM